MRLSARFMDFGDKGSPPAIKTFIPLSLIRDRFDSRAGDFMIFLIRVMSGKQISIFINNLYRKARQVLSATRY